MAFYFFDLITAGTYVEDPDGQELGSLHEAMQVAELTLCEIAGESLKAGENLRVQALVITDDQRREIVRVTTEEAIQPRLTSVASVARQ